MLKESRKITSGTGEWAFKTINTHKGCKHNCPYCYAKKRLVALGKIREEDWELMIPNRFKINKGYQKVRKKHTLPYDIMYPSSHDIHPDILDDYLIVLKKLLRAGNRVLIVSKPWPYCIEKITNTVGKYKNQIGFRFTITSTNKSRLAFWEPNAPSFDDRINSLIIAFVKGFKTSVSIEPHLDQNPIPLIKKVAPYVRESIWLGKMNYIKAKGITEEEKPYYDYQRKISSWSIIQKNVEKIKLLPEDIKSKIRLKDSIVNMYKKHSLEVKCIA